ncbi:hypothetical protein, partial [Microbulbifer epialgicus]
AGLDVQIAAEAGKNAAENNALPAYLLYLGYVYVAANLTLTAVEIYNTIEGVEKLYEELNAAEGDPDKQKQIIIEYGKALGVEIAIEAAAAYTGTKLLTKLIEIGKHKIPGDILTELGYLQNSFENSTTYQLEVRPKDRDLVDQGNYQTDFKTREVDIGRKVPEEVPLSNEEVDELLEIKRIDENSLPNPDDYLPADYIEEHQRLFDDGVVRFTFEDSYKKYSTFGPDGGFVMPRSTFDEAWEKSGGNLEEFEQLLELDAGYFSGSDKKPMIVAFDRADLGEVRIPRGNEGGAYEGKWVPGGYTAGGSPEAVVDFQSDPPTSFELLYGEI